jgi:hypothetical protein
LHLNRDPCGIEGGLHQRLDVSHNDDRCRVRNDNAMLVLGMMPRLSNSLFMQWRDYQRRSRPCHHNRFPVRFVRTTPPSGTSHSPQVNIPASKDSHELAPKCGLICRFDLKRQSVSNIKSFSSKRKARVHPWTSCANPLARKQ